MRFITRSTLLSVGLFAAISLLRAEDATSTAAPASGSASTQASKKKDHTELEEHMEEMGGAFKKLRRQITDPSQNASSLDLVATVRAGAEKAVDLTPLRAQDIPEAERAKFIADYQKGIKNLQVSLGKLEAALKANDNTEAAKILKEVGAQQKEGHKQFMRPE